jgi:hypothetical protein
MQGKRQDRGRNNMHTKRAAGRNMHDMRIWVGWDKISGHVYNIVNYQDSYRIMDYHQLGYCFITRSNEHETNGVGNDRVGTYGANGMQSSPTWDYPTKQNCRPISEVKE